MTDINSDGVRYIKLWVDANPESNCEEEVDFQQMFDSRRAAPTTDTPMFGSHYQAPDVASRAAGSGTHHAGLNAPFRGIRPRAPDVPTGPTNRSGWPYATVL